MTPSLQQKIKQHSVTKTPKKSLGNFYPHLRSLIDLLETNKYVLLVAQSTMHISTCQTKHKKQNQLSYRIVQIYA